MKKSDASLATTNFIFFFLSKVISSLSSDTDEHAVEIGKSSSSFSNTLDLKQTEMKFYCGPVLLLLWNMQIQEKV